jgi:hypothetical protein
MHYTQEPSGGGWLLQQAQQVANAAQNGADFAEGPFTISVCDVDLPAFIWDGAVFVQVPLEGFFDAITAAVLDSLRDLEVRVSEAGRAALSSTDFRSALPRTPVVESRVVRDSGEQR